MQLAARFAPTPPPRRFPAPTLPDSCGCAIVHALRYEHVDAAWASFGKTKPHRRRGAHSSERTRAMTYFYKTDEMEKNLAGAAYSSAAGAWVTGRTAHIRENAYARRHAFGRPRPRERAVRLLLRRQHPPEHRRRRAHLDARPHRLPARERGACGRGAGRYGL